MSDLQHPKDRAAGADAHNMRAVLAAVMLASGVASMAGSVLELDIGRVSSGLTSRHTIFMDATISSEAIASSSPCNAMR
jgi:hypothetical protein